jgi:hypothetical protein
MTERNAIDNAQPSTNAVKLLIPLSLNLPKKKAAKTNQRL